MEIQFRTNLIKWGAWKDGTVRAKDMFALKDPSEYGNDATAFIATELLPDKIAYKEDKDFDLILKEYEDRYLDDDEDPAEDYIRANASDGEINAARVFYVMIESTETAYSKDELLRAYFESPDVSKMKESDLESVFIQPFDNN